MNWYLETELRHGTVEWDVLREEFMRTFNFEDGFKSIVEAPQEVKVAILRISQDPLGLVQIDWSTLLHHALK